MLSCPCGVPYRTEDIDLDLGVAHCDACGAVSEVTLNHTAPAIPAPLPVEVLPDVHHTYGWLEESTAEGLTLSYRWLDPQGVFILVFTLFWNGIVFAGFTSSVASLGWASLGFLAVPHVWIGVGMAYYSLAVLLNRTEVRVTPEGLSVTHSPVPWRGTQEIPRDQIDQLYVQRSMLRVNRQRRWNLSLLDTRGTGRALVRLLTTTAEARFLERRLEQALGIEDRPVSGEETT